MSDTEREADWVEKIGKPTAGNLREMVAALGLDYDRLQDLRDEREALADAAEEATEAFSSYGTAQAEDDQAEEELSRLEDEADAARTALREWDEENAEELKELEEAAKPCGNECADREDAERMILEDALSVEVRSGWVSLGPEGGDMSPEEFQILLSTGGPAARIMGELDERGEPYRAWLEVQDWGKPWTHYYEPDLDDVLLSYARCFCFAS